ncbi:MAG: ADP-ribosylglycohydrolase family protein [Ruminococcaceae bacterium]|nr:ADP-ribosylglycohydrolase family protein [Oscillospiraceae bacterium]
MFGALYGDIIGSYYETHATKDYDFELRFGSTFTDDSVMTAAVCDAILGNPADISIREMKTRAAEYAAQYRHYYDCYPDAGYGTMFSNWAKGGGEGRLHSYGNGGAMRVVPIGYAYEKLEQVLLQATASCAVTHDNADAINGAKAVAACVWIARKGGTKDDIRSYVQRQFRYNLERTVDEIRPRYQFEVRASRSVPEAIIAFLDSHDYESAVRNAVSLGGDADTQACIAGGIAEAFYGEIPENIRRFCDQRLDSHIRMKVREFKGHFGLK